MCGILGIQLKDNGKIKEAVIRDMLQTQKHRGPDNTDYFIEGNIALGHNRLSIIDLSSSANQPMNSADGKISIVFNGEIYNYRELRNELKANGYQFASDSDTEVLLNMYHQHGESCLEALNGMFAFGIYDRRKRKIMLARDRFGQKPLFYYFDQEKFIFSSELKTMLQYPGLDLAINNEALDLFLSLQYIPAPYTIYKNIAQVQPSEYVSIGDNKLEKHNYFDIAFNPSIRELSYEEAKEQLRNKVIQAVKQRKISDVPLGTFLSGGIDSSIITAILAQNSSSPINTVSVGFEEKAYSELDIARTIAQKYNTNHNEYVLDINEAKNNITDIISSYDQPFGDASAIPTYYLSKVTRRNVTVALSGDGGDELFRGYHRYFLDQKLNMLQKWIPNPLLRKLLNVFALLPPQKNVPIEKNYLLGLKRLRQAAGIDKRASILRWGSFFSFMHKQLLYKNYPYNTDRAVNYLIDIYNKKEDIRDYTQRIQYSDLYSYAHGDYLVKTDIASMQHALEVRSPFLDHNLANFVFSLPPHYLQYRGKGKHILKDAFKTDLTPGVLSGSKRGFGIPIGEWFRNEWLSIFNDFYNSRNSFCKKNFNPTYIEKLISEHKNNRNDHSKRLYLLFVLEVWNKHNSMHTGD